MKYARTITAYHGCERAIADQLLEGAAFRGSDNPHDWLGHGIYFWEYGPDRARRWAEHRAEEGVIKEPDVVGALVNLGICFDLMDTRNTYALRKAFAEWREWMIQRGLALPANKGKTPDKGARLLDCAVLNWFLTRAEETSAFQTVRCAFVEGEPIFEGSQLMVESHIQLCVRDTACILGVFRPSFWHE